MKVYVVVDDSKACYDAGGIFVDVFATKEEADAYLAQYGRFDRGDFGIEATEIGELESCALREENEKLRGQVYALEEIVTGLTHQEE